MPPNLHTCTPPCRRHRGQRGPVPGLPLRGQNPAGAQANVQTVAADICVQSSATFTHFYGSRLHRNVMRFDNSILSGADMSAVGWNHRLHGSHVIAKGR